MQLSKVLKYYPKFVNYCRHTPRLKGKAYEFQMLSHLLMSAGEEKLMSASSKVLHDSVNTA